MNATGGIPAWRGLRVRELGTSDWRDVPVPDGRERDEDKIPALQLLFLSPDPQTSSITIHMLLLLLLLLLLTPNEILKKTENRVLLSISE